MTFYKTHIKITSYAVFLTTLAIVLLNLITLVFPALIFVSVNPYPSDLNPLEVGPLAIPLFVTSSLLIGIGFAFYKKKLPNNIRRPIEFLLNFEISHKTALIVGIILLLVYVGFSAQELYIDEKEQWPDYKILEAALKIWPYGDSDDYYVAEQLDRHVRMFLLFTSLNIFQNIKILPFVASILLVMVTYFLTRQISGKRFAGIISMVVLLQSYTFLEFDSTAVYENFWVLFYVLSLLIIYKKWYLSPILYLISVFTKAYATPFIFMTIFFIYRAKIAKKKKIAAVISYVIAFIVTLGIFSLGDTMYEDLIRIDYTEFLIGFTAWANQMRFDLLIILTILPLTVGLFLTSKRGIHEADSILFLILGTLVFAPIVALVTDFYFILPYRYVPLIVFFAVGIGVFLSKKESV